MIDPWFVVYASYGLGVGGTVLMVGWSWAAMRAAEKRRDKSRER